MTILLLTAGGLLAVAQLPPVPQDPAYHRFADARSFAGVPNFLNVVSNLPLAVAGGLGLRFLRRRGDEALAERREVAIYALFFAGALLTAAGSAWYHLAPDNARLCWDRLPMAITFMAFTAAVLAERVGVLVGFAALFPMLAGGIGSVLYWYFTERSGAGDLRPYGFVHFYPPLLMVLLMRLFPSRYSRGGDLWGVLLFFALAVGCELLDRQVFALGGLLSGHTLKHLLAAAAVWWVLRMLDRRRYCGN